jgi:hypothetical protein
MSLARDALASGDMVMAESYFQHAEHYNRIIMAAQQQFGPQHGGQPGEGQNGGYRPRWNQDGSEDDGDMDGPPMGGGETQSGMSQDRERHVGDREHHAGRDRGRQGGNGRESGREGNGSDQPEASHSDESATDPVG